MQQLFCEDSDKTPIWNELHTRSSISLHQQFPKYAQNTDCKGMNDDLQRENDTLPAQRPHPTSDERRQHRESLSRLALFTQSPSNRSSRDADHPASGDVF
jgi:hypothetical protein